MEGRPHPLDSWWGVALIAIALILARHYGWIELGSDSWYPR